MYIVCVCTLQIIQQEDGHRADGQRRVRSEREHEQRARGRAAHPALDSGGVRAARAPQLSRPLLPRLLRRPRRHAPPRQATAAAPVLTTHAYVRTHTYIRSLTYTYTRSHINTLAHTNTHAHSHHIPIHSLTHTTHPYIR